MAVSHAQPSTIAAVKASMTRGPPEPDATAAKLPANTIAVIREYHAQPRRPSRAKGAARTNHPATRQANPPPAETKCATPRQLTSPTPSGVPGGKPSDGFALKMAAASRPAPKPPISHDPHIDGRPGPSARPTPTAAAIVIAPVTRKLMT